MKKTYPEFEASKPYFDLVRGAVGKLVDGEHSLAAWNTLNSKR